MSLPAPNGEVQLHLERRVTHPTEGPGTLTAMNPEGTCAVAWDNGRDSIDVHIADLHEIDEATEALRQIQFNEHVAKKTRELQILEAARARLRAEKAATVDFDSLFLTRAQLSDLPKAEPLIHRVLPRHSYAILRGRDHSYKSFVAVDWACSLATGKPWHGHTTHQTPVLYIAGEGAHGLHQRVEAWEYAWGRRADSLTIRRSALNLHQPGPAFDHLLDHIATNRYGLVVVDTLRRVSGAADGNSSEMGAVVDNLDRIKRATADGTVLAVAHTDKGDHDTRGYSGIEDDADVIWAAKRDHEALTLELTKMKDGPDGRTIHLTAQPVLESLILNGSDGTPTGNTTESQTAIVEALRLIPDDRATGPEVMSTAGLRKPTFYRALKELKAAGHVLEHRQGQRIYYLLADQTLDGDTTTAADTPEQEPDDPIQEHLA